MTTSERSEYQQILEEQGQEAAQEWLNQYYPEPVMDDEGVQIGWNVNGQFETL